MGFGKDFLWGGATAANQYEGGVFEGGAGLSTADVMTNGAHKVPRQVTFRMPDGSWDKLSEYVWNSGTGLGDNQQRWLRAEVRGSGTYSFDWSVTSQKNADFLSVYVDGVKVDAISGSTEWITKQLNLTCDYWHSIIWVYSKDDSIGQSYDCGRLAYLEWTRE